MVSAATWSQGFCIVSEMGKNRSSTSQERRSYLSKCVNTKLGVQTRQPLPRLWKLCLGEVLGPLIAAAWFFNAFFPPAQLFQGIPWNIQDTMEIRFIYLFVGQKKSMCIVSTFCGEVCKHLRFIIIRTNIHFAVVMYFILQLQHCIFILYFRGG